MATSAASMTPSPNNSNSGNLGQQNANSNDDSKNTATDIQLDMAYSILLSPSSADSQSDPMSMMDGGDNSSKDNKQSSNPLDIMNKLSSSQNSSQPGGMESFGMPSSGGGSSIMEVVEANPELLLAL